MLKITVEGQVGDGKSSAALFIAAAFREAGIEVEVKDQDVAPEQESNLVAQAQLEADATDRLRVAAERMGKITIETRQLPRE